VWVVIGGARSAWAVVSCVTAEGMAGPVGVTELALACGRDVVTGVDACVRVPAADALGEAGGPADPDAGVDAGLWCGVRWAAAWASAPTVATGDRRCHWLCSGRSFWRLLDGRVVCSRVLCRCGSGRLPGAYVWKRRDRCGGV